MTEAEFLKLVSGKSNPQSSFMMGRLKVQGKMNLALKLQPILTAASGPKAKL